MYRVLGRITACSIRQDRELVRRQHFEQIRLAGILADIHAAHGDGDDLRTAGDDRATRLVMVLVLAGTNQQTGVRSEEHTSELQSLMRISYAVFCLKKKNRYKRRTSSKTHNKEHH